MSISFGGVSLPFPTAEEADWVCANIPADEVYEFAWENWPGQVRRSGWAVAVHANFPKQIELGRLYWPTGASRWAVGHYLCTSTDLQTLRGKAYRNNVYTALTLKISDESGRDYIQTDLYLLPPRPLAQIPGQEQLYLLTLVDERFWWWITAAQIVIDGGTTTWAAVYTSIGTALGVTITGDAVDTDYGYPSETLTSHYEYLPLLLDAAAVNTGRVIVRYLDGTVVAQTPSAALAVQTSQSKKWDKQAGGEFNLGNIRFHDFWSLCPASVKVAFQRTDDGVLNASPYVVTTNLADLTVPGFPTGFGGFAGRAKTFHDTATAVYESSSLTNSAALTALAGQVALDWYTWRGGNQDVAYAGIVPWVPEGMADHVSWTYRDGRVNTRVQRRPWNDLNEELNHGPDPVVVPAEGEGSGVWVLIDPSTVGAPYIYSGTRKGTYVPGTGWSDSTSCWVYVPNEEKPRTRYYLATQQGTHNPGSGERPFLVASITQEVLWCTVDPESYDEGTNTYDALWQVHNASADTWSTIGGVYARFPNDETPVADFYYFADELDTITVGMSDAPLFLIATSPSTDTFFKVSANDTTANYGNSKLTATAPLYKAIVNPAGNETLNFYLDYTTAGCASVAMDVSYRTKCIENVNYLFRRQPYMVFNSAGCPSVTDPVWVFESYEGCCGCSSTTITVPPTPEDTTPCCSGYELPPAMPGVVSDLTGDLVGGLEPICSVIWNAGLEQWNVTFGGDCATNMTASIDCDSGTPSLTLNTDNATLGFDVEEGWTCCPLSWVFYATIPDGDGPESCPGVSSFTLVVATDNCESGVVAACCEEEVPLRLWVKVVGFANCTALDDEPCFAIDYDSDTGRWIGEYSYDCGQSGSIDVYLELYCDGSAAEDWKLAWVITDTAPCVFDDGNTNTSTGATPASGKTLSCDPFEVWFEYFTGAGSLDCGCCLDNEDNSGWWFRILAECPA